MDDATQTAPVAPAMFRAGLRRLAGGVTIIATGSHGARAGLTATAVMSLTAEPPAGGRHQPQRRRP
ncbi:flavin reductase [Tistrella bauzanensis]